MDTVVLSPNLTMLRVRGWQVYVWRDGDTVTVIDSGAPGSGAESWRRRPGSTASC